MKEIELTARAIAAASAARYAGFFETAEALMEIARHSDGRQLRTKYGTYEKDLMAWCCERAAMLQVPVVKVL